MNCPRCPGQLSTSRPGRYLCAGCSYEINADAWQFHQELLAQLDTDEDKFFERVKERTARLRSLEPAWQQAR